jgi:high-affinity K+ transport system ATPase subunit B
LYADFGAFAIVYYCMASLLAGASMKVLVTRLRRRPDAGTFLLLLVFLDVGLIPTGAGGLPLILYYGLAHVANGLARQLPSRTLSSNRLAQSGRGSEAAGDAGIVA